MNDELQKVDGKREKEFPFIFVGFLSFLTRRRERKFNVTRDSFFPFSTASIEMIKRSKQLPSNSLPLRYRLSPSLSNSSPCPCIVTSLPFRNHAESLTTSNTEVNTQDVRLGSTTAGVEVVRILDPEYR